VSLVLVAWVTVCKRGPPTLTCRERRYQAAVCTRNLVSIDLLSFLKKMLARTQVPDSSVMSTPMCRIGLLRPREECLGAKRK